jgi:hypothetical protein
MALAAPAVMPFMMPSVQCGGYGTSDYTEATVIEEVCLLAPRHSPIFLCFPSISGRSRRPLAPTFPPVIHRLPTLCMSLHCSSGVHGRLWKSVDVHWLSRWSNVARSYPQEHVCYHICRPLHRKPEYLGTCQESKQSAGTILFERGEHSFLYRNRHERTEGGEIMQLLTTRDVAQLLHVSQ